MRSRRSGFAATDASSRSTATRIASTRCGATTNRRSLPSSTGPDAGAMRRLPKSTRSWWSSRRPRFRWSPARASRQHAKQRGRLSYRRLSAARRPRARARPCRHARMAGSLSRADSRDRRATTLRGTAGLDIASFGDAPRTWLLEHGNLPADLRDVYAGVSARARRRAPRVRSRRRYHVAATSW